MGTLHIVATPIGNLEDVTLRALRVLREADWVLAEDTRRTRILLDHFSIPKTPTSLHAHNEVARLDQVLAALEADRSVALVSDAGTPLVSDPGARLVAAVAAAGHHVDAVPGASALLAALCVAGLDSQRVLFLGFLPRKKGEQIRLLERQKGRTETLVLFESPHRVAATLSLAAQVLGDRPACLARELTKRHEEVWRDGLRALAARSAGETLRGECTIVVAGAAREDEASRADHSAEELDARLDAELAAGLARGESVRDLAGRLATATGRPKRAVYARALALRTRKPPADSDSDSDSDSDADADVDADARAEARGCSAGGGSRGRLRETRE
ncbi:MAG: 16S rRNA (cytidine(1402)-2'-O)-methyltransferase [Myxococcota bacterium]